MASSQIRIAEDHFCRSERVKGSTGGRAKTILTVFGTRPEVIKLAPVIKQLEKKGTALNTFNVSSSQHVDLLAPFVKLFKIRIDHDLGVMTPDQTPDQVCARVLLNLSPLLDRVKPDMVVVQGDTTTAMATALAAFHRKIPVAHVEAGLRSGDDFSPYPEEMNRKLITRLASYHFAATARNRDALLAEGVAPEAIFVTGNPVVDALGSIKDSSSSPTLRSLLNATSGYRRIVLTTHRRESLGSRMIANLQAISSFVRSHSDVVLIFPVHPNPQVVLAASQVFHSQSRVQLVSPLGYSDFIHLVSKSWLVVSDSGGVQEEAPSLGKPLLIIRENTERPEVLEAGVARLVRGGPLPLQQMLEETYRQGSWAEKIRQVPNPFGQGDAGKKIGSILTTMLNEGTAGAVRAYDLS